LKHQSKSWSRVGGSLRAAFRFSEQLSPIDYQQGNRNFNMGWRRFLVAGMLDQSTIRFHQPCHELIGLS
jgi:hypothetical protein